MGYGADPELAPIENPLPNGDPRLESSYRTTVDEP
jgi:hypothetical protein